MWRSADLAVNVIEADGGTIIVDITTPAGTVQLMGELVRIDTVLEIDRAHIGGLSANACGLAGLRAIARKLMEAANVDEILIQGSTRTSGANPGRYPDQLRLRRSKGTST